MKQLFALLLSIGIMGSSLFAQQPLQLQQPADVEQVMDRILDQHVEKNRLNHQLIRASFKVYIEQFDPEHTYLLMSEVTPYMQMSDAEAKEILAQYRRHDFSAYEKLNARIQRAILRARNYRNSLESHHLLSSYSDQPRVESSKHKVKDYAQTTSELKKRQYQQLMRFVEVEKQRYGEAQVIQKQGQLIDLYHRNVHIAENGYLFQNPDGEALASHEQKSLFYMHVLKALANSLDHHTTVFNANEAYDMRVRLEKGFDGIGIVIKQGVNGYFVKRLLADSPAERHGDIAPNDRIVTVEGKEVDQMSVEEVMDLLRGPHGSNVSLTLARQLEDGKEKEVAITLTRELIVIHDGRVETDFEEFNNGIIGLIKLHSFYQGKHGVTSERDLRAAIAELDNQGKLRGLILDLRDNNGGFLTQAVKVAGLFITNGVIVISKYSDGEEHVYRDMDGKVSYQGPLIVLTSKQTASAAEIVAQALQDYGVALIVGDEQTYGKGTIQSQTVTNKEGGSYFKVTVGKYYTVSGKTPQKHGVKADIIVPGFASRAQVIKEVVEYPPEESIPPAYDDALTDIDPNLRPWYMRYYVPTLQQRHEHWTSMLPELRKKSGVRIAQNDRYQSYLHGDGAILDIDILDYDDVGDPQLHEAVNIVKDMIRIESRINGTQNIGDRRTER